MSGNTFVTGTTVAIGGDFVWLDVIGSAPSIGPYNLYDPTDVTEGKYIGGNGSIGNDNVSHYTGLIPVEPGETYTVSGTASPSRVGNKRYHGYDATGKWVKQLAYNGDVPVSTDFEQTMTIPSGVYYMRISVLMLDTNVQLEKSPSKTDYVAPGCIQAVITSGQTVSTLDVSLRGYTISDTDYLRISSNGTVTLRENYATVPQDHVLPSVIVPEFELEDTITFRASSTPQLSLLYYVAPTERLVNKVERGDGTVLIDLTADTVSPEVLLSGYTAHAANGEFIIGINEGGSGVDVSADTVTPQTLLSGYTAHMSTGSRITGTYVPIDLSSDTVTPQNLLSGYTAHNSAGSKITGAYAPIDLSSDTVTPQNLLNGYTAHNSAGSKITGAYVPPSGGSLSDLDIFTMKLMAELPSEAVSATKIGNHAFFMCEVLTSASFPNVTTIQQSAFMGCGALTNISFPNCTLIGGHAFASCGVLESAIFPKCGSIGLSGFYSCSNLKTISFPSCSYVGTSAFQQCSMLEKAVFPNCTNLGSGAFYNCCALEEADFPKVPFVNSSTFYGCSTLRVAKLSSCTSLYSGAFSYCLALSSVSVPMLSTIGLGVFRGCGLESISLPRCSSIMSAAFTDCVRLSYVYAPSCKGVGSSAFAGCLKLLNMDLPVCSVVYTGAFYNCYRISEVRIGSSLSSSSVTIWNTAFYSCSRLMSFYVLCGKLAVLSSTSAFTGTPISGSGPGSIYVPQSLYSQYIVANNWSVYSSKITSI